MTEIRVPIALIDCTNTLSGIQFYIAVPPIGGYRYEFCQDDAIKKTLKDTKFYAHAWNVELLTNLPKLEQRVSDALNELRNISDAYQCSTQVPAYHHLVQLRL